MPTMHLKDINMHKRDLKVLCIIGHISAISKSEKVYFNVLKLSQRLPSLIWNWKAKSSLWVKL